jgi:arylsulfatase A-like enzyme
MRVCVIRPNRRPSIRRIIPLIVTGSLAVTLLVIASLTAWTGITNPAARRPNVLLIVTDDQRSGLGVMPFTRRFFADDGRRYPRAYVSSPLCCPARASILTGRYGHNNGVTGNDDWEDLEPTTSLVYRLRRVGYKTALFGKLFNNWPASRDPPHFDRWALLPNTPQKEPSAYRRGYWNVNGNVRRVRRYSTEYIERSALSFLTETEETDDQPWLMLITPAAPHSPYVVEATHRHANVPHWEGNPAVREVDRRDKPPWVRDQSDGRRQGVAVRRLQYRTLLSVDEMVKALFEGLEEAGEADNTIAFFMSDNAIFWGEHGLVTKGHPYTEDLRVPFMVRWPDRVPAGSVDRRLVSSVDVAPTVLRAARLSSETLDGRDLLDLTWERDRVLIQFGGKVAPRWTSVRTDIAQYVEYYSSEGETIFREYYDLRRDPWMLENLLRDGVRHNAGGVGDLARQLHLDSRCSGDGCP